MCYLNSTFSYHPNRRHLTYLRGKEEKNIYNPTPPETPSEEMSKETPSKETPSEEMSKELSKITFLLVKLNQKM